MQLTGNILDGRTLAGELLLYRNADALDKVLVAVLLLQLFLLLRCEHRGIRHRLS
jgi:hypothetical protein